MRLLAVDNYIEFKCVGGDCPISCCGGGWGIMIDDETYRYYMSVEGEFGEELRTGITLMNGRKAFKLDSTSRDCVFLSENKLCRIYRNLGLDALCETCRTYPRAFYHVGDIEFCYLANSCPEVNRMIMQRTEQINILFDDSETDVDEAVVFDSNRLNLALNTLTAGMHIIQNREITLRDRLIYLLFFVNRFQELIIEAKDPMSLISIFSDASMYTGFLKNELSSVKDYTIKIHAFMIVFSSMLHDSYDHPMWIKCNRLADTIRCNRVDDAEKLEKAFLKVEDEKIQVELEQIMVYRFFVSFMQGYDNLDYIDKLAYEYVMFAALETYIALTEYDSKDGCSREDRIWFVSLIGRLAHSLNKGKEDLLSSIRREGFNKIDKLLRLVL